jgi:NADH:ubiquinone oxidoreductase subunit E
MTELVEEQTAWIEQADEIVDRNHREPSALIAILQDVQREIGYLPLSVLGRIADRLGVPLSRVYSVATFYKAFKLKPTGKHIVKVCLGTACHIKGGPELMRALSAELGVPPEEATEDGKFSYEPVRCVGCCGLAPVIMVDENFHGKLAGRDIKKILSHYE